jgi:ElaB/YqjD/DUF883 family membrane-anchored ribosome-binding protein
MASRNTPISDVTRAANTTVDEARSMAADRLDSAASAVENRVGDLPGGQRVKDMASAAVGHLSSTADYMRSHDAKRMMADVEEAVKNNPGPALLVAAAFGFVLGRALTRG